MTMNNSQNILYEVQSRITNSAWIEITNAVHDSVTREVWKNGENLLDGLIQNQLRRFNHAQAGEDFKLFEKEL